MNRLTSHRLLFNKTKKCQKHQFNMIQPQEKFFIIFIIVSRFCGHDRVLHIYLGTPLQLPTLKIRLHLNLIQPVALHLGL